MLRNLGIVAILILFVILTVLTQVGGIILLLCIWSAYLLRKRWKWIYKPWAIILGFPLVYLVMTFTLIPLFAQLGGRVALPCFGDGGVKPLNLVTCVCNRHYVVPELREVVAEAGSTTLKWTGQPLRYLDANFPFIDGFPLIPHLSHNDGRKLDLAFYYQDAITGKVVEGTPSPIGYGVFEGPKPGEPDKPGECASQGEWQYGFMERLVSQAKARKMPFDAMHTKAMLLHFAQDDRIKKMFLEPHLKQRLGLMGYNKVRFQGCHSVRHDDHVHIQL